VSDVIHKKHKDRYRIQFCDENFYLEHQKVFQVLKSRLARLTNVEKLQAWVVILSCLRRSKDWYGGPRARELASDKKFTHSLNLGQLFLNTPVILPAKLSRDLNVFDFINHHRIKALPESCFRSLVLMTDKTYPLLITSGVVEPIELLQIQISGQRIVSIDEDIEQWPTRLYSERDYLGFILHDLIHADHFFHEPKFRDAQLGFYRFVNTLINDDATVSLLHNENFRAGFEYIISDMNSHPLHLFQTLHSLLYKTLRNDAEASTIWQRWISNLGLLDEEAQGALLRVNAQDFKSDEALMVEAFCRGFSAK
jgi:hypothetical protein